MQDFFDAPCYLNGEYTLVKDARVSVLDRGFLFGDAVYEVIPVYQGQPFRFEAHMARLDRSLSAIGMANPMTHEAWRQIAQELIDRQAKASTKTSAERQALYVQVSRGAAPRREHAFPLDTPPTVLMLLQPVQPTPEAVRDVGLRCITAEDFRWQKAHIKSTSLLGAVLARQMSVEADADETILVRDGLLTEGSASNIWVVKNGRVAGPVADHHVLEGVRYGVLESLCADLGLPFELRPVKASELLEADEVLLSSALREILPVTSIDGQPVGTGQPGAVFRALDAAYQRAKAGAAAPAARPPAAVQADTETLIEFPSLFPIKVMGPKVEGFIDAMTSIANEHDPAFDITRIQLRDSSGGKYQSITLTVTATSREQLDNLYRALTSHPLAKYVL